ncbi:MAG: nucleotidyltransferase family protein [Gemmatimonadaceae bacterium]
MTATKLVVLARGLGTRMRAATTAAPLSAAQSAAADAGLKAMIPIDRPFLDYSLSALADAGVRDVCLVIGPEHDAIRDYYASVPARRLRIGFATQERPIGTADAVLAAREFTARHDFLVVNADNYYPAPVIAELSRSPSPALPAFSRAGLVRDGQIAPDRIARYALLDIGSDGVLHRIVEKPTEVEALAMGDARVSMNCWLFDHGIFEACRRVPPSSRGEHELPLAAQFAIDHLGMRFHTFDADAPVLDLSHREDIASVASRLRGTRVEL